MHVTGLTKTLASILAGSIVVWAAHGVSQAQQRSQWPSETFNEREHRQGDVAGQFDYYALVLSWSPTFCSNATARDRLQCDRQDGRRYAFVLHGLWPQYERGYPGDCRTARRPFVPPPLIDSMLDIMPSPGLVTHEYRKHGTCSGLDPQSYFALSRQLYNRVRIPEKMINPFETQSLGLDELARDFLRANPGLKPEQFAIACSGGNNGRLKEIRFCFSKTGEPRACGDNENQRRMCSAERVFVPPVRSTARDNALGDARKSPPPAANDPRRPLPNFKPLEGARGI